MPKTTRKTVKATAKKQTAIRVILIVAGILILSMIVFRVFIYPSVASRNATTNAENAAAKEVSTAAKNLPFSPYYPTYVPSGLEMTLPKLRGFTPAADTNEAVTFFVGKVDFQETKQLVNQSAAVNPPATCDISTVYATMLRASVLTADHSATECRVVGTTKTGATVYSEAASHPDIYYYFMAVGDTDVIAQYNTLLRPQYADNFEQEILKVFDSLQPLDTTKLIAG